MTTITYSTTLTKLSCGVCHIPFAMPTSMHDGRKYDGKTFYCPNGHSIAYSSDGKAELEAKLAREKRWRESDRAILTSVRDQLEATERSLRGHKAAKTRIKNRIAAGVCPCCNRQFENLHRHMTGQHPDYTATNDV